MLPPLRGLPIRVELKNSLGPHHAATSIPRRLILLDRGVLSTRGDFERILIHEIFHFAWVHLSNQSRRDWETLLASERQPGELGWSAEWRKLKLTPSDRQERSQNVAVVTDQGSCQRHLPRRDQISRQNLPELRHCELPAAGGAQFQLFQIDRSRPVRQCPGCRRKDYELLMESAVMNGRSHQGMRRANDGPRRIRRKLQCLFDCRR